jgi:DNA polymerase-3 subunit delta'
VIHPWQQSLFSQLTSAQGPSGQSLLLFGRRGIGKHDFALHWAATLLCEAESAATRPCNQCDACGWFAAGHHPDFLQVTPQDKTASEEDEGKRKGQAPITIDQIREARDFALSGSNRLGRRLVLIEPAESMNTAAANALLKSLEEPRADVVYLLVSHQPRWLPATVRSRCLQLRMPQPTEREALEFLQQKGLKNPELALALSASAPLLAAEHADAESHAKRHAFLQKLSTQSESALPQLVEEAAKLPLPQLVEWLQQWSFDLMEQKTLGAPRFHLDLDTESKRWANTLNIHSLLQWERQLRRARREVNHPLNPSLFCQTLLTPWFEMVR